MITLGFPLMPSLSLSPWLSGWITAMAPWLSSVRENKHQPTWGQRRQQQGNNNNAII